MYNKDIAERIDIHISAATRITREQHGGHEPLPVPKGTSRPRLYRVFAPICFGVLLASAFFVWQVRGELESFTGAGILGLVWAAFFGCVAALATSLLVVLTKEFHGHYSMDGTVGVQKFHSSPTPRIGGLAVLMGALAGYAQTSEPVKLILAPMLMAAVPALSAGLLEDITKKVGVRARLIATMLSGVIAWYITGVAMQNTGVPPLDWVLGFTPIAVLFTAFAVAGVTNAINIIDGFNGLAAGAVTIMFCALGVISLKVGDGNLAAVCFILAAVTLGFAAVNWPLGKLFLGDGGAYFLGFLLAWIAVLLPMRNPQLSGWVTLLACAYPILEVAFSYRRKSKREGHHPGQPDKLHFHMLVHRRIARRAYPQANATLQNSMTSPYIWAYAIIPASWAVAFHLETEMLILGFVCTAAIYWLIYLRMSQFEWRLAPRRCPNESSEAKVT